MYARDSRYRDVPEVRRRDPSGRTLLVTDLRLRAPVAAAFRHTVESNDRLDHLAHRFYRKPTKWWRISDANAEFASPLALLGQDPITVVRLATLPGSSSLPLWWRLLGVLRAQLGVEDVRFDLEATVLGGAAVQVGVTTVTFNRLVVAAETLATAAAAAGFPTGPPQLVGRLGKPIAIPPEGDG
jgi:hypothetical protein